jgi:ATP-binding cassette subfamily C (CFTR/MRP) protein 4
MLAGPYGGDVGLAITQCIGLIGMIQWGMRQSAELENSMTSLERILEYTSVESEPPLDSPPGKYFLKTIPSCQPYLSAVHNDFSQMRLMI